MKKMMALCLMTFCVAVSVVAKEGFTTTFDISGMPDSVAIKVRLHDSERGFWDWRFDTIQVVNGRGVLADVSGVTYPVQAYADTPYGSIEFYVSNNENERISGSVEDIANLNLRFEGASWSDDLMEYNRRIEAPLRKLHKRMSKGTELSEDLQDSLRSESKAIEEAEREYCLEYPNSWMTLIRTTSVLSRYPRDVLAKVNEQLTPDRRESKYGEILTAYLSTTQISEGDSLIDFDIEAPDQNGQPFKLSEMKEPYIVVDFSQCYCGPCIQAVKEIRELREKYAGKIGFVNYSCDELEKDWRKAVKRDNVEWPSLFDGTGPTGPVCLKYNVSSYPTFFIFGPDRKLITIWKGYGPEAIEFMLPDEAKATE